MPGGQPVQTVYVVLTMDCETPRCEVSDHGTRMSASGPADGEESARSIEGFARAAAAAGFPVTLLAHPEVAAAHPYLLGQLQREGACLGLHLHPYKLAGHEYDLDLGAYPAAEQRQIVAQASAAWEAAVGQRPRYFRAGYFSASDATFSVLEDLGFAGGSLSNPGRILPEHASVWSGAEVYPHRAHRDFRQLAGDSAFVEVPVSGALGRPVARGHAGEQGFEWLYVPHTYDHAAVVNDILDRFERDRPALPVIVTDTHDDQEYADPEHPTRRHLEVIFQTLQEQAAARNLDVVGTTLDAVCDQVRGGDST